MEHRLKTNKKQDFYDITPAVEDSLRKSGVSNGVAVVFIPHTTAGVTINENADPDVISDLLFDLGRTYPEENRYFHSEGNSDAHIKASLMGSSCTVIIEGGRLLLGTWQSIFFCEFDGPRNRTFYVKIMEG